MSQEYVIHSWWPIVVTLLATTIIYSVTIVVLFQIRRSDSYKKNPQERKAWWFMACAMSGFILLVLLMMLSRPSPHQQQKIFKSVFQNTPDRIDRFVILPPGEYEQNPLPRPRFVIEDPAQIQKIHATLLNATPFKGFGRGSIRKWTVRLEMVTKEGSYFLKASAENKDGTDHTVLEIGESETGDGWVLGYFLADGLDQILLSIVNPSDLPQGILR